MPVTPKPSKRALALVEFMKNGKWVNTEDITGKLGYLHPNRALTDVRHAGYVLEFKSEYENGRRVGYWRLTSAKQVNPMRWRNTLTRSEQIQVFERDNYTCSLCRKQFLNGESAHLRADHKGPVSKMGDVAEDDPNWMDKFQTLCHWCNYEKREICKKCTRTTCIGCELYDPKELFGVMLKLDRETFERLQKISEKTKSNPGDSAKKIIQDELDN